MTKFEQINEKYPSLPYMNHYQALYMKELIQKNKLKNLCELGHYHGKSSIYFGAILEEQGFGTLTTFDILSNRASPNINSLISEFSLEKFINPVVTDEGYVWGLSALINNHASKFDFCYIDGGHTFESTTLAFILTDLLLEKNGIIVFDDVSWTVQKSMSVYGNAILNIPMYKNSTAKQKTIPQVKMVCDLIMPHYNYTLIDTVYDWAVYQKN
jgi:predicted O-methyltransferase YrrM